jgi:hypothetical protein
MSSEPAPQAIATEPVSAPSSVPETDAKADHKIAASLLMPTMNASTLSYIANLSYCNELEFRDKINVMSPTIVKPNHIHYFDAAINGYSDAQMYVLTYDDCIIFTVRGTSSLYDTLTNVYMQKKLFQDVQYSNYVDNKIYKKIKVHAGFLSQYNTVKFNIIANVFEKLWKNKSKSTNFEKIEPVKVIFTSHSLGAAISTLAAATLKAQFTTNVAIENWTFGCPRVGNKMFVKYYNDNVDKTFRYVCGNDIITKIPKIGFVAFKDIIHLIDENGESRTIVSVASGKSTDKSKKSKAKANFESLKKKLSKIFGNASDHAMGEYIRRINKLNDNSITI